MLTDSLAVVDQDVFLLDGSIRQNLTMWDTTIDESGPDPTVTTVMLLVTRDAKPELLGSALVRQVVRRTAQGWRIASREIQDA